MRTPGAPRRGGVLALLAVLLVALSASAAWAVRPDEARRVQIGLRFFPNVLSVDMDLAGKQTAAGKARVLLLYREAAGGAERLAETLRKEVTSVAKIPFEVTIANDPAAAFAGESRPCGIFLTEYFTGAEFQQILRLAIANHVILFSPFEEDLERGATAGLDISSKIRPSLNTDTLSKSGIRIHPMFLRLAKIHD